MAAHCGLPVTFANDANAAAYGEFWVGSGRDFHSMVLFTLGTGIGCGIIVGDLSIDGENGHGAECGHIIIDCSETPGSAAADSTAISRPTPAPRPSSNARARPWRPAGPVRLANCSSSATHLTPKLLAHEAEAGDALSLEIVAETARYLAVGIVNLMHTIDPSGVLLGGAMTFGGRETRLGPAVPGLDQGGGRPARVSRCSPSGR